MIIRAYNLNQITIGIFVKCTWYRCVSKTFVDFRLKLLIVFKRNNKWRNLLLNKFLSLSYWYVRRFQSLLVLTIVKIQDLMHVHPINWLFDGDDESWRWAEFDRFSVHVGASCRAPSSQQDVRVSENPPCGGFSADTSSDPTEYLTK